MAQDLFQSFQKISLNDFEELTEAFFTFWLPYKQLLNLLEQKNLLFPLQDVWYANLSATKLARGDLASNHYAQRFALGGMFALLLEWVRNGTCASPQEMRVYAGEIVSHLRLPGRSNG